jgi:hypothetical protein
MRFDEINDGGGINGRKIKVIIEDTAYQVPKAVQACNKLINRDKVFAFVAPLGTPMNNACFKDQFAVGVPNLFPLSAARSMYEPYERLKFYGAASYVDQVRSGIDYFVKTKGKKAVCVMYQDTDFGKEVLEGAEQQVRQHARAPAAHRGGHHDIPGRRGEQCRSHCADAAGGHLAALGDRLLPAERIGELGFLASITPQLVDAVQTMLQLRYQAVALMRVPVGDVLVAEDDRSEMGKVAFSNDGENWTC